jgi:hypothetical protein
MPLDISRLKLTTFDPLERIEAVLDSAGWQYDREEDGTLQAVAETRWGDMGAMFAWRPEPAAIHYSLTLDVKPIDAKRGLLSELIVLANERLWLGHFDYWADEGVVIFRATFPLMEREAPTEGEVKAVVAASVSAVDRFIPAFNFLIWAGKSPREAMDAAMFETHGEA